MSVHTGDQDAKRAAELWVERAVERWFDDNVPRLLLIDKAERRTDHQNYLASVRRLEYMQQEIFQAAVAGWMRALQRDLQRGIPKAMRARSPTKAANSIVDWDGLERGGRAFMITPVLRGLVYSITAATEGLMRKQADPAGEAAIDYADKHTADLVTSVTRATKDAIKLYIGQMVKYGMTAQKIAQTLRPVVGLLPRHATAVSRFLTRQLDKGIPFDEASKKAKKYAENLHRYRTRMIARTESSFAQAEGTLQAYEAMGVTHVRWVADPEACAICRARNGNVYSIKEAHGMQPAHPHCECAWVAAAKPKPEDEKNVLATRDEVWKRFEKDGNEHLAMMYDRTRSMEIITSGARDHVFIDYTMGKKLKERGCLRMIHNHPSGSAFSGGDLSVASYYNVKNMEVITKSKVYNMRPRTGGIWPGPDKIERAINEQFDLMYDDFCQYFMAEETKLLDAGTWTEEMSEILQDAVNIKHREEACKEVAKKFKLVFEIKPRGGY